MPSPIRLEMNSHLRALDVDVKKLCQEHEMSARTWFEAIDEAKIVWTVQIYHFLARYVLVLTQCCPRRDYEICNGVESFSRVKSPLILILMNLLETPRYCLMKWAKANSTYVTS